MKSLAVGLALLTVLQAAKPPKTEYDKAEDRTYYSTGGVMFRRGSSFGYLALYSFRGKGEPLRPDSVVLNFYTRRQNDSGNPAADGDYAKWSSVNEVVLRWSADPKTYSAKAFKLGEANDFMKSAAKVLGQRTFMERLRLELPTDDFLSLAQAKELNVRLGDHTDTLSEGTLKPIRELAATIPPKS